MGKFGKRVSKKIKEKKKDGSVTPKPNPRFDSRNQPDVPTPSKWDRPWNADARRVWINRLREERVLSMVE